MYRYRCKEVDKGRFGLPCSQSFKTIFELQLHCEMAHGLKREEQPFKCGQPDVQRPGKRCLAKYANEYGLSRHLLLTHDLKYQRGQEPRRLGPEELQVAEAKARYGQRSSTQRRRQRMREAKQDGCTVSRSKFGESQNSVNFELI